MFVTYAQNFEDLMLFRALGHLETGFYVDVGANLPAAESVTKAFYDRGWSGINIEPADIAYSALVEARERDVNLKLACGRRTGKVAIIRPFDNEALGTIVPEMAAIHGTATDIMPSQIVDMTTLAAICREYVGGRDIHFLKVDVEAAETEVFEGADLETWRPWIILGEAHGPDFTLNQYQAWEDILLRARYRFAYSDGLNRFYIATERWNALAHAFTRPPNVFDQWVQATHLPKNEVK